MALSDLAKKLIFRSWHRGTREMDLLIGRFADAYLPDFTPAQLEAYAAILELPDPDLYNWITGQEPVPDEHRSEVMALLVSGQRPEARDH